MPRDLLFTVIGSIATPAVPVTLAEAGLRERRDLQEWVLAHPEILGDDTKVVTFEFDQWEAAKGSPKDRLDVLGLSSDGKLVVAELKRDKAPDTVEMQAVKYAAMASRFTPLTLAQQHARFLADRGEQVSEDEALERLETHAGPLDVEKLRKPKIVMLAGEYPPTVTATAVWLSEMGLDFTLALVQAYRTPQEVAITVSQLYPVPSIEDFMVTPRQAEVKAVEEKRQRQHDVTTTNRLVQAKILEDEAALRLRPEGVNSEVRAKIDEWVLQDPRRERARWFNQKGEPLVWEADNQRYSPSGLAGLIVTEAAGISRSVRGGDWWVTEDGRDLVEIAQEVGSTERQRLYRDFWTRLSERLHAEHPEWVAGRGQPSEWNWFEMPSPIRGSFYSAAFIRNGRIKYELYVDSGTTEYNERVIQELMRSKDQIEAAYGGPLIWNPPDDRHRYGAVVAEGSGDITDVEHHDDFAEWFVRAGERLRPALEPHASAALKKA